MRFNYQNISVSGGGDGDTGGGGTGGGDTGEDASSAGDGSYKHKIIFTTPNEI